MIIPRKSYTATYKLSVLQFAEERSIKEACLKFHIDPSMISRWKSKQEAFSSAKKTCKRVGLSGRPVSYPVEERDIFKWIVDLRSNK